MQAETEAMTTLLDKAREMGEDHGRNAASWYFDGNTDRETYERVLRGIEDGDPAIMDEMPSSPLSGEWADDPTPATVLADLDAENVSDETASEIMDAYEMGFYEASQDRIVETARRQIGTTPEDFDPSAHYKIGALDVAWYVVAVSGDHARVCMVGDDRVKTVEISELEKIGEEDFCRGCGQIGCGCEVWS